MTRLLSVLTLIALVFASATPKGWMATTDDNGEFMLVICTGDGVVERAVVLASDAPGPHPEDDHQTTSTCPYSTLLTWGLPTDSAPMLELSSQLTNRWATAAFTHESAGFHRRYDARGPPTFS